MAAYDFVTLDVFTDTLFGGNPLAVFPDARGLSGDEMQAIAKEFNLSETTFVQPPSDPANTANVRIFTPAFEMPFAGHPNIGTAAAIAAAGHVCGKPLEGEPVTGRQLRFEEKAGLVVIDLDYAGGSLASARLTAPQEPEKGGTFAVDGVAYACGLEATDILTDRHQPVVASCGARFLFAEAASLEALGRAAPNLAGFNALLDGDAHVGIHLYVRLANGNVDIQSRMFAPNGGVPEDPATGSANVALVGLTAMIDPADDLDLSLMIAQGVEMGRPSLLHATASKRGGIVEATTIGGTCVPVMSGTLKMD